MAKNCLVTSHQYGGTWPYNQGSYVFLIILIVYKTLEHLKPLRTENLRTMMLWFHLVSMVRRDSHICVSWSWLDDRRSGSPTDKPACRASVQPLNLEHWNIDHTQSAHCLHVHTQAHTPWPGFFSFWGGCSWIWMEIGGWMGEWIWTWMGLQIIAELEEVMQ